MARAITKKDSKGQPLHCTLKIGNVAGEYKLGDVLPVMLGKHVFKVEVFYVHVTPLKKLSMRTLGACRYKRRVDALRDLRRETAGVTNASVVSAIWFTIKERLR